MNVSWCDFNNLHVQAIANNIPSSVTQLNISGYRQNLIMEGEESMEFGFVNFFFKDNLYIVVFQMSKL